MRKTIAAMAALFLFGALGASSAKAAEIVVNGGFETGSLSGWTVSGQDSAAAYYGNYYGVDTSDYFTGALPYAGNYEAFFGANGGDIVLSQVLATVSGQTYNWSFAVKNDLTPDGTYTTDFTAKEGSTTLLSLGTVAAGPYHLYSGTFVATGATTTLSFASMNPGGFWDLDAVSVTNVNGGTMTPEPGSLMLLGTGLIGLAGSLRKRLF